MKANLYSESTILTENGMSSQRFSLFSMASDGSVSIGMKGPRSVDHMFRIFNLSVMTGTREPSSGC